MPVRIRNLLVENQRNATGYNKQRNEEQRGLQATPFHLVVHEQMPFMDSVKPDPKMLGSSAVTVIPR
jgi:hypothetical protein